MEIRALTPDYAVSPQINPADVAAIKAAGYTTVICNRPDREIPEPLQAEVIGREVEAAGMTFVVNPVFPGALTEENVQIQSKAIQSSTGPVFAYCASGNRSSIVWALAHVGKHPTDHLISIPARFGYQLEGLRPMLDARAKG
ncbi:beta-lactamase hydrolase-like protein [mine drainage metagenome]|uniref:Beta-lactamase hydrolase-like protein n=1 Tax=mine drainage metagenome TaxID=410659 RepID=A0A1J5PV77_9ZZZZ